MQSKRGKREEVDFNQCLVKQKEDTLTLSLSLSEPLDENT